MRDPSHDHLTDGIGHADAFALVDVDVCADEAPPLALADVDELVDVCELAFPEPEPPPVELVDELVDVEACEEGEVDAPVELPADVDELVPVLACEDEPPLAAWVPVDVVVPV